MLNVYNNPLVSLQHPKADKSREKTIRLCSNLLASTCCCAGINSVYRLLRQRLFHKSRRIVLLYHSVTDDVRNIRLSVSVKDFREQMKFLKSHARVFPLDHLINRLDEDVEPDKAHVSITFDDGYMDNFENAYPILQEYNLPATIFLVSDLIGTKDMLTAKEIKEMRQHGISYGSHTVSHPVLSELDINLVQRELIDSKCNLEALLQEKVDFLAYPKGRFNDTTVEMAKDAGYKAAFTIVPVDLRYNEPLTMGRIPMRTGPMSVFKTKLTGLYHDIV